MVDCLRKCDEACLADNTLKTDRRLVSSTIFGHKVRATRCLDCVSNCQTAVVLAEYHWAFTVLPIDFKCRHLDAPKPMLDCATRTSCRSQCQSLGLHPER